MSKKNTNYVQFHKKDQVEALDQNYIRDPNHIVMFPRHLYGAEVMTQGMYRYGIKDSMHPRDLRFSYIYGKEVFSHPDHFTRFSYNRARYGYGTGHVPGKYSTFESCSQQTLPRDMAPERLYGPEHWGCFSNLSQAQIDETKGKYLTYLGAPTC